MQDSWLNQPASFPELRLRERFDEQATEAERRQMMIDEALKAIVARIDALSAQVAEVRAAVGLPVEEPPGKPGSEGPAAAGWDS
jgi:hypothetical protein